MAKQKEMSANQIEWLAIKLKSFIKMKTDKQSSLGREKDVKLALALLTMLDEYGLPKDKYEQYVTEAMAVEEVKSKVAEAKALMKADFDKKPVVVEDLDEDEDDDEAEEEELDEDEELENA